MNRLYKVVFNKARGQCVACGEHSKTHTKSKALKAVVFSAVMGLSAITGSVYAADIYSIYDKENVAKTTDVDLVKHVISQSPLTCVINAYHTGDNQTQANRLTVINNSVTPKVTTTSIPSEMTAYYSSDVALYYNNAAQSDDVNSGLKLNAFGVTVHNLYGTYIYDASAMVENVSVNVGSSTLGEVYGGYADNGSTYKQEGDVSVNVTGNSIVSNVFGINVKNNSTYTLGVINASDIDVKIVNSQVSNNVYGGYVYNGSKYTQTGNVNLSVTNSDLISSYAYGVYAENSIYEQEGKVNITVLNSLLRSIQGIYTRDSYINVTDNVNVLIRDLRNNSSIDDNIAGFFGSVKVNPDNATQKSQITGDINVTFIAFKQFTGTLQNYTPGGLGQNIYGAQLLAGTLVHNGNINVSIGGTSVNTNLTHSLYGSFALGGNYKKRDTDIRTLYFGAYDENNQLVKYESDSTNQFKASFANFDRVVVREGSSLYIGSQQTDSYYQQQPPGIAYIGISAEYDPSYNKAIMSYSRKFIMPEKTSLVLEKSALMHVDDVQSTGANITVDKNATLSINQLTNKEKVTTLTLNGAKQGQVSIGTMQNEATGSLSVHLTKAAADELSGSTAQQLLTSATKAIDINQGYKGYQLHVAEGAITGALTATVDSEGRLITSDVQEPLIVVPIIGGGDGNIVINGIQEAKNETISSLTELGFNGFQVFRSQMNDLDKRMGDLRTMPQASGAWARAFAGQSKYKSTHNNYKTLQAGVDYRMGNFFGGVMASYTDGDGSVKMGDTDDKNYSFGLYGGWLADNGQFVDITIKRHHLESDYDLRYKNGDKSKGSYHTAGTSISAEYGWRLPITNTNFYVEPQVEFMYGHLNSVGYTTSNGVRVNQSAGKTAVGRLGAAFGYVSPDKSGSAYIKASVLNDWEADMKTRASKGDVSRYYHDDMGGTWGEFAIGGTYNLSKDWSIYGEAETTAGSPVRTTYQFSAGVRYSF